MGNGRMRCSERNNGGLMLPKMLMMMAIVVCLAATAQAASHKYSQGDVVPLYANKVGPFSNPSETYQMYKMPFCAPEKHKYKLEFLGEVLEGDRLVNTPYSVEFLVDKDDEPLCSKTLDKDDIATFREAISKDYYFQMIFDDLPLWGFIGKMDEEDEDSAKLFLHTHFDVHYNEDRVIEVNVATDPSRMAELSPDKESLQVSFTYSVKWKQTTKTFEKRMDKYSRFSFLPQHLEIHWFSIINSFVTVLLLTGFLATILMRVLKNDFAKYSIEDDLEEQEESGWKYIHGDVFRFPKHSNLFCATVGVGTQFFLLVLSIFILSLIGLYYPYNRGAMKTSCLILYALTAGVAGYSSGVLYKQMGGTNWVRNNILTSTLFCGPLLLVFAVNNTVAIAYDSTQALPFGTICIIIVIWVLVTFPLTVLGGIAAKNSKTEFNAPSRTNKYAREIPELPWFRAIVPQMCMAGFLPFSAIYIELYYIFASVWGHKVYTIYSILFIVFVILIIVTAFITIALTYFQLAAEDHRWWWHSLMCGGSTAFFILGYCFYYYFGRSDMTGLMQTSFYFGYSGLVCYAFFLLLGMVGYRASLLFVRSIYKAIKCD